MSKAKTYFLHVDDAGVEERFTNEPVVLPALRVEVVARTRGTVTERTFTKTVFDARGRLVCVPPRGDGWVLEREAEDCASWLRTREKV